MEAQARRFTLAGLFVPVRFCLCPNSRGRCKLTGPPQYSAYGSLDLIVAGSVQELLALIKTGVLRARTNCSHHYEHCFYFAVCGRCAGLGNRPRLQSSHGCLRVLDCTEDLPRNVMIGVFCVALLPRALLVPRRLQVLQVNLVPDLNIIAPALAARHNRARALVFSRCDNQQPARAVC
jgi:hypothetical protein